MDPVTLPSGKTISGHTWAAITADGTWHGWLDAGMYSSVDREFMDAALQIARA
ncbi:MAG: hypothetical protein JWQ74_1078 [Marmoricola sp.]|nr:hypothetical protein [Marmoricola sp.]